MCRFVAAISIEVHGSGIAGISSTSIPEGQIIGKTGGGEVIEQPVCTARGPPIDSNIIRSVPVVITRNRQVSWLHVSEYGFYKGTIGFEEMPATATQVCWFVNAIPIEVHWSR